MWVRQAGGSSYEGPSALAADAAGNCYMAGDFQQTISFGTTSLASSGTRNNFFVKYNADGEVQWAQKAGGAGFMELPAATADAFGNLYVTGYFSSNVTFGASNVMSRGGVDAFVAKFNSNGVMQWFQSAGESNRYAFSRDVAVNSAGAVFMTGNFASMSRSFEASIFFGTNRLISAGYSDAFFAKYSNDGALQSVGRIGGQGDNDNGYCIAAYGNNNIYAAGFFTGTATIGNTILDGVGSMFLTKLVPVGTPRIIVDGNTVFGGSVFARGSASIVLETGFAGGTILYSLNGSDPALSGFLYSGPFVARRNATLRAVAYNADFTQAVPSDPVEIVIVPTLSAATAGGGSVAMDPPAGAWWSNGTAVVTATPAPGWTFLHWLGDATGTNPAATVSMSRNRCVQAIFGAGLGHTVVGSGSVARSPAAALYPHGTAVRLTAVPAAGNYFALWGNAASGTNHPLNFVVTNANATVTAVFAALPANQHALTVLPDGFGSVSASPRANRYGTGANVTLTATPDAGQSFVSWSGDASGTQNPLTVVMNSSKVITANFTKRPRLAVFTCGGALDPASVPLLLSGEFGGVFVIEASADLQQWSDVATVTNLFGTVQFNDTTGGAQRFYRARPGP